MLYPCLTTATTDFSPEQQDLPWGCLSAGLPSSAWSSKSAGVKPAGTEHTNCVKFRSSNRPKITFSAARCAGARTSLFRKSEIIPRSPPKRRFSVRSGLAGSGTTPIPACSFILPSMKAGDRQRLRPFLFRRQPRPGSAQRSDRQAAATVPRSRLQTEFRGHQGSSDLRFFKIKPWHQQRQFLPGASHAPPAPHRE